MSQHDEPRSGGPEQERAGEPPPAPSEHEAEKPTAPAQPRRGGEIRRDAIKGLLFTILLLAAKSIVEQTAFGKQWQTMTYNFLQGELLPGRQDDVPVAVVDITDLQTASSNVGGRPRVATPRKALLGLLRAVADAGPAAIGVDIDFSPREDGYVLPEEDSSFFQACLHLSREKRVPIFLGIARSRGLPPEDWLGDEDFQPLAANIIIPHDTKKMLEWTRAQPQYEPGPTLGAALAGAFQRSRGGPPRWLHWAVEKTSETKLAGGSTGGEFLVDYSPLEHLIKYRLKTKEPRVIEDQGRLLEGRVVLVGDGTIGEASDAFVVPGRQDPIPGVYLHACAAYTLTEAPLYGLTDVGRLAADLLLSLSIIAVITGIRLYYRNEPRRRVATHRVQALLTALVALAAFAVAVVFVRWTRLMWDDFIVVILTLLLHPWLERACGNAWKFVKSKAPALLESIFFERDKGGEV